MNRLIKKAAALDIHLSEQQAGQFSIYYDMLIETNKVMNLTAITDLEDVMTKHFLDSMALCKVYPVLKKEKNQTLLDLGTGAGFPAIPLKIAFPHLKITMMDSLNKRVKFLHSVIERLELCDITAVHGRAEEAARNVSYREQFDLCVSRAVANLSTLSEYCIPFVKTGGMFIAYKSSEIEEELKQAEKAVNVLGARVSSVEKMTLPESDIERSFVMIEKVKNTPKTYPRKAGTASREPIK